MSGWNRVPAGLMRCPLRVCLRSRHSQEKKYKFDSVYYIYRYVHIYIYILHFHIDIYMYTVDKLVVPWKLASVDCEFQYAATNQ